MIFKDTKLSGVFVVELEALEDERGFFARSWCAREFEEHGLQTRFVQSNISFNKNKGTLRGMHYQAAPHPEVKLVRCTRGAIFDVVIDLRPDSPTFTQWISITLTADNHMSAYIPKGFAHGFQSLEDCSEVFYQMSEFFAPECARGVRWNDPAFGIKWPPGERTISKKDQGYPDFKSLEFRL